VSRLAARQGQATVEWLAVLSACAILAVGATAVMQKNLQRLPDPTPRLTAIADATSPRSPTLPSLGALPLPDGDGDSIVVIARRLLALGIAERPPGSNSSPEILQFTDGNAEAWCADFVSWVLRAAGTPFTGGASGGWRLAWTPDVRAWFAARDRYRSRLVASPQPGDVIWFVHGHVGFVTSATADRIETIEGNSGDALRARTYDAWRSNSKIHGFGRPVTVGEITRLPQR
jgi:hypothetical protein